MKSWVEKGDRWRSIGKGLVRRGGGGDQSFIYQIFSWALGQIIFEVKKNTEADVIMRTTGEGWLLFSLVFNKSIVDFICGSHFKFCGNQEFYLFIYV